MKFGKVLKVSSENMPEEMHDLFLRYKDLKKQIKLIPVSKDAAAGNEKQASVSAEGSTTGSGSTGGSITASSVLSREEQAFITTLNEDLARFNRYFIEKEEEAVIRLQALCDELAAVAEAAGLRLPHGLTNAATSVSEHEGPSLPAAAAAALLPATSGLAATQASAGGLLLPPLQLQQQQQMESEPSKPQAEVPDSGPSGLVASQVVEAGEAQHVDHHQRHHHHHGTALHGVKSRLVQFHGEMVLLLHWSLLNYAAVVKILKKHDKRTGVLLRAPYLANVLQQPFSSTTIMSRLAKRAEELVVATTQLSPPRSEGATATAGAAGATSSTPASASAATATEDARGEARQAGEAGRVERPGGMASGVSALPGSAMFGSRMAASASDASTLTFAADKEAAGHPEALVGSTMHALETWATLRKNAITPSTVLAAEVEQQQGVKRKAEAAGSDPDAAAATLEAKNARSSDAAAH